MSKFKYSDDEMDVNKVLKMNKDISLSLLQGADKAKSRNESDLNIEKSMELLKKLGKNNETSKVVECVNEKGKNRVLDHKAQIEKWDDIVREANIYEPNPVVLEDIMTESEINAAFEEADEINKKFSQKTSIINKTDLSFLAIAIAL